MSNVPDGTSRWTSTLRDIVPALLVDLAVVVAWIAALTLLFRVAGWSLSLYYVLAFLGVLGYSLVIDPWDRLEGWTDRDR